jgi:hypothetical protein
MLSIITEKKEFRMKKLLGIALALIFLGGIASAAVRGVLLSISPNPAIIGNSVTLKCDATGSWQKNRISNAQVTLWNASGQRLVIQQP